MQKYRKKQKKARVSLPNHYLFSDGLLPYFAYLFLYPNNSVSIYFVLFFNRVHHENIEENLKVSFYFKKNVSRNGLCPVMGRITIGKDMVQFSCKLEADPKLWDTRAGRMNGKSAHAYSVNRENVPKHAKSMCRNWIKNHQRLTDVFFGSRSKQSTPSA